MSRPPFAASFRETLSIPGRNTLILDAEIQGRSPWEWGTGTEEKEAKPGNKSRSRSWQTRTVPEIPYHSTSFGKPEPLSDWNSPQK